MASHSNITKPCSLPLVTTWLNSFNALGTGKPLHETTLQTHISVIPKDVKDPTLCGHYRPISLLNTDFKLFTKIIAIRIQQHLPDLIHLDQVGFVPLREARDNTTEVLNLLHMANITKTPCVFLGADAEKAFDRVHWPFMFSVLRHVGLGSNMLNWITSFHSGPSARVKANGVL